MKRILLLPLCLAASAAAHPQDSTPKSSPTGPYCSSEASTLFRLADGNFMALGSASFVGDLSRTTYPGGKTLFAPSNLAPFITVGYRLRFTPSGAPIPPVQPITLSVSSGRIAAGAVLGPRESLMIRVVTPSLSSRAMPAESGGLMISTVSGKLNIPEYGGASAQQVPDLDLARLGSAIQRGDRWLVVSNMGKDLARIPLVPKSASPAEALGLPWIRKTIPLLAANKCA